MAESPRRSVPPPKKVSWQRTSSASRRSLSDGWGFTATGLIVAFCGWGIWAAAAPSSVRTPIIGLVIMLLVAAGLFALTRFLGFIVIERMWGRRRLHARWAHLFTGLFLTFAGVAYFVETTWIVDGIDWLREQWQRDLTHASIPRVPRCSARKLRRIMAVSLGVGWVDQRQTSAMRGR